MDAVGAVYCILCSTAYYHAYTVGDGSGSSSLVDPISIAVGVHKSLLPNDTKLPG